MRQTFRGLCLLVASAVACGEDPKPLTVRFFWTDGCDADPGRMLGACTSQNHLITGSQGARNLAVDCTIRPATDGRGYEVFFQAGSLPAGETSFENGSEGISVAAGTVPGTGMEMDSGRLVLIGNGWQVTNVNVGSAGPCHVFIDAVSGQSFRGRIACSRARDNLVPYRDRFVKGAAGQTADDAYGEFTFQNCRTE